MLQGKRVVLVDTPGFDDQNRTDAEVLSTVAAFMKSSYEQNVLLSGIIYLHRITDVRMSGSGFRNLNMFKEICGDNFYSNVALATTMWENLSQSQIDNADGNNREQQLLNESKFWKLMAGKGSQVFRHANNRESALHIVTKLVSLQTRGATLLQHQMVDLHMNVLETGAGVVVEKDLLEERAKMKKEIEEREELHKQALEAKEYEWAKMIEEEKAVFQKELSAAEKNLKELSTTNENLQKEVTEKYKKWEQDQEAQKKIFDTKIAQYDQRINSLQSDQQETLARLRNERAISEKRLRELEEARNSNSGVMRMLIGGATVLGSVLTLNPVGVAAGSSMITSGLVARGSN
jgi:flagellar biosynthesis GTPase FlhF